MNRPILLLMFTLLTSPLGAQESEIDSNKKTAIEELMRVTGALQIGEQFGQAMREQMTMVLQKSRPDIPQQAFVILGEEVQLVMSEEMASGAIENLFFPLYDKYFSLEEIHELLDFYKTEIGKKSIEVLPLLTQESMQAGQVWGATLGPKIAQRIRTRLAKEGIEIN
jgi:hypothetical protein